MTPQSKGAKEKLVTRIIVSRCEVDLKKICSEYKANFGQSLQKTILVNESYRLPLAYYRFTIRFVLSCSPSNLLCFCRNTPRETTRRHCSACVDGRNKNQSSVSKGLTFQRGKGAIERWTFGNHTSNKLCGKSPSSFSILSF